MASGEEHDERQVRAAKNQALFREINERVRHLNELFGAVTDVGDWVCECANETCVERVQMQPGEYEAVRAHPGRFVVAPSDAHVWADVEIVVGRTSRFWTVEKFGAGAELAERADPRSNAELRGPLDLPPG